MDRWFDRKSDNPGGTIGEVKDETDIKAAFKPTSDTAWQATVVGGS
ncbi:uncharacterized protein RCO7_14224 [Rhynchosporium graminicola]|uniref:Uncharacterized protein n=1 Tax=Rhynchosporium graminicola TaxID=2792576 RepID=A0A1E1K0A2_9HELO|nr:uncharacterized protein RCO7_14224 [Rhynchosporium commune]